MKFEMCESRGFDGDAITARLGLVDLADPSMLARGKVLQDLVIRPNVDAILDSLFASFMKIEDFIFIVSKHSDSGQLKEFQRGYLSTLGVAFDRARYFEDRLRIGAVHQSVGITQSLYQCSFQALQFLLIQHIPQAIQNDRSAYEEMIQFILKITALDMSLAVESYCAATTFGLRNSLKTEQGEKERLHQLAVTDSLTDLHNRSYSRRFLVEALDRARRETSPLCVIMADMDHFKEINDVHGHLVGDQVLQIAAARMVSGARTDDKVGRYGGEEFLFILQDTDIAEGLEVAERVRTHISSDTMHGRGVELSVSLSLGIAQAREGDDVDTLIDRADAALYAAKLAGRDCVRAEQ